ncbi:uncharacterized protein LOC105420728 [Amborella trichopoda]|uniref:uncharacterized protein LOC105420728 n=1 Tax=Amborella trichopoda TaxID=13333 RepID=UPI0005D2E2DF|nr:uncharacterized protein LOC105420728 [Amborella trichopoda]|eukprot:XP_011623753.1 uncharacterized protein LOC105420728 [Amborella trichopoda]
MEQYAAKFAELSRYAPHIINTEARKANKFERGLKPDIRGRVISTNLKTFSPLVDLPMKIERDCEESRVGGNWKMGPAQFGNLGRKTRPPPRRSFRGRDNQRTKKIQKTSPGDIRENQRPTYPYCGNDNHSTAECRRRAGACFRCGKPGHLIKDCLVKGPENQPKTQGRVFALTEQEAKVYASVIRGTLFVCGMETKILIDPRSSHSFVALDFAFDMNARPSLLG